MLLPLWGARARVVCSMFLGAVMCLGLTVKSDDAAASSAAAVKAALGGNAGSATQLARQSGDAAAAKLVEWVNVTENWRAVGYERIMAFIASNPGWPSIDLMHRRAEWLLFNDKPAPAMVRSHFSKHEPVSHEGRIAFARALQAAGEAKRAAALIAEVWSDPTLSTGLQRTVSSEFKQFLDRPVLEARLWRMIHAHYVSPGIEAAKSISTDHVAAAQAAAELIRDQSSGVARYNRLPASMQNQRALLYALARYYRRAGDIDKARDIVLKAPSNHAELIDAEKWWIERRILIRQSIGPKNKKH